MRFVERVRGQERFADVDALRVQMADDVESTADVMRKLKFIPVANMDDVLKLALKPGAVKKKAVRAKKKAAARRKS